MGQAAEATGTLDVAIAHARTLLGREPRLAEEQAREIIHVVPRAADAHILLGVALSLQGQTAPAIAALREGTRLAPDDAEGWRQLAAQLQAIGDEAGAVRANAEELRASTHHPALRQAALALGANDLPIAERILRAHLKQTPDDIAALRMLAELAGRLGRYPDARVLLEHALDIAPGFTAARYNLAIVLHRQQRGVEALAEIERLLDAEPDNPAFRNLNAAVLAVVGDLAAAVDEFERVLAGREGQPKVWMSYGHALKTIGRQADAVSAYRKAIDLDARLGEAWWSLANLKTVRFDEADIVAMEAGAFRSDLRDEDGLHFHFALGKAHEDAGRAEPAFHHYAEANRLRRAQVRYSADALSARVTRAEAVLTPAFFTGRAGQGCPAPDPIFILGMPRAGSTLIEQILASHPLVEGTQELPEIQMFARRDADADGPDYPATLASLSPEKLAALGREYLERTRIQRRTDRPFFIDKMPNNWAHVPLIHLILPNAKIIDARRHPLACCFSNYKQHFARGQAFSYDFADLGRYYADYVRLMDHVDALLPGRVHRVFYEAVVADIEGEVRRLLAYLGLDFDPACLSFHENDRAVRTASSEQVRQPIFRDGLDQWRRFDPWLGPLRDALGPALEKYPFGT
jgi:tetratricopeptide (TPR) repeat protein